MLSEEPFKGIVIQHLNYILKRGEWRAFWLEVFGALQEGFSVANTELSLDYNYGTLHFDRYSWPLIIIEKNHLAIRSF